MDEKVVEVLETAKNILESEMDWCQHKLHKYDGPQVVAACAIGAYHIALNRVFYQEQIDSTAAAQALRCLYTNVPPQFKKQSSIAEFNDDPNTTKEDVLLMYKRAIEEASQ